MFKTVWLPTFYKISYFVFHRTKYIDLNIRASKWWQIFIFGWTIPLNHTKRKYHQQYSYIKMHFHSLPISFSRINDLFLRYYKLALVWILVSATPVVGALNLLFMVPFKASPTKAMEMNKAITSSVELRGHTANSEQLILPFIKATEHKPRHNNKIKACHKQRLCTAQMYDGCLCYRERP